MRLCWQMLVPPRTESLHLLLTRLCWQMLVPPRSPYTCSSGGYAGRCSCPRSPCTCSCVGCVRTSSPPAALFPQSPAAFAALSLPRPLRLLPPPLLPPRVLHANRLPPPSTRFPRAGLGMRCCLLPHARCTPVTPSLSTEAARCRLALPTTGQPANYLLKIIDTFYTNSPITTLPSCSHVPASIIVR